MSSKPCSHIQAFKKTKKKMDALKWIHWVFVIGPTTHRETKISNSICRTCKKRGPNLHACIECVHFGCQKHIREHMKKEKHTMSIELTFGQLHCFSCGDYIYDTDVDAITNDNKMQATKFNKRLFEWTVWEPTEEERFLLTHRTNKIRITPDSAIGLRGLINVGSTCYISCILQALIHTPLLRDYFLTERHKCTSPRATCIVCEVSIIFQEFYSGITVPFAVNELLQLIWSNVVHLAGPREQDAHEFFIATLQLLHQHSVRTQPDSGGSPREKTGNNCPCIIDRIFAGGLQSDVVCQKCKGVSTTIDPILDLSLDLPPDSTNGKQSFTLIDCLDLFTRSEHLGENVKIMCSKCKSNQEATKQLKMKTLPIVVCFHLKRFEHIDKTIRKKISTAISFPEMLDLTPFMSLPKKPSPFPVDNRYSLFAVINHIGKAINNGHYTAYVRQQYDYWYKCNDDVITRANLEDVLNSEGYLLFYHRHVLKYD